MSLGGEDTGECLIEFLQRSTAPALRTRFHGHIRKQLQQLAIKRQQRAGQQLG
jgi:hypothetical protein